MKESRDPLTASMREEMNHFPLVSVCESRGRSWSQGDILRLVELPSLLCVLCPLAVLSLFGLSSRSWTAAASHREVSLDLVGVL